MVGLEIATGRWSGGGLCYPHMLHGDVHDVRDPGCGSGFSRKAAQDRTHRVRAQPDVDLMHTCGAWIELDPVRFERDTVERHACNAGCQTIGIRDDDVNALTPDVNPRLESLP
jgi:hypothetical protein